LLPNAGGSMLGSVRRNKGRSGHFGNFAKRVEPVKRAAFL
jgi:hypothetical protein